MSLYESGTYLDTNPDWHDEDGPWKAEHVAKMLERNHIDLNRIADVGCGTGRVLASLQEHLPKPVSMTGFDVAGAAIELAQGNATDHLDFRGGDFLKINKEVFDLVLLMDVFEHVPDYLGFLEALHPHGKHFMFHIPLDMNVLHVLLDHQSKSREMAGHLHYFSKSSALLTLEEANYEVVDWFYTPVFKTAKAKRSFRKRLIELPRSIGMSTLPDLSVRLLGGCSVMALAKPKA